MKAIHTRAAAILAQLITGLDQPGDARTIGGPRGGAIMPVSVECIGPNLFSVSHYYEQNGDLMADPDMTFWRGPDGRFYPASFQQDNLGCYQRSIEFGQDGQPTTFRPRMQKDHASFAGDWMINIRDQQSAWFEAQSGGRS